jgi:RNA-directed DNA polymerase
MTKSYIIPKKLVMLAYKLVKANKGSAGVDKQSLEDFERNLEDNLYKIWNRMSSGSYFPPAVKAVAIPKKAGGIRILGVPTVGDRIAQMVVKLKFEPDVEPYFLSDSYGYRPNKSALDAVRITRQRCWKFDWVLEFDIKDLFDNIPHDLLMKVVRKHSDCKWVIMYIERWLKASIMTAKEEIKRSDKGTPQGGIISPLLSNLFLHYVYDLWMKRNYPDNPWCRYADDGLAHCRTELEAKQLLKALRNRLEQSGLELHPDKTKIIYCKDTNRKDKSSNKSFDFLGYTFRCREARNSKSNKLFGSFSPAVSKSALKSMRQKTRKLHWRNRTDLSMEEISKLYNPVLVGWNNYYGRYYKSAMGPIWSHFNRTLVKWAMNKYKCFRNKKTKAAIFIEKIAVKHPKLFVHWQEGIINVCA